MLDINGGELLVLAAVGVVVLGPERLPQYAAQLGKLVRQAKTFTKNAREQVAEEMGEDFSDIDWDSLDPRRYDPRRIVREALLDDDDDDEPSPRPSSSASRSATASPAASGSASVSTTGTASATGTVPTTEGSSTSAGPSVTGATPDQATTPPSFDEDAT